MLLCICFFFFYLNNTEYLRSCFGSNSPPDCCLHYSGNLKSLHRSWFPEVSVHYQYRSIFLSSGSTSHSWTEASSRKLLTYEGNKSPGSDLPVHSPPHTCNPFPAHLQSLSCNLSKMNSLSFVFLGLEEIAVLIFAFPSKL